MNFLSSEEHAIEWEKANPQFANGSAITLEAGLEFISAWGRGRDDPEYAPSPNDYRAALRKLVEVHGADPVFWGLKKS